jgi:hypothetical protein
MTNTVPNTAPSNINPTVMTEVTVFMGSAPDAEPAPEPEPDLVVAGAETVTTGWDAVLVDCAVVLVLVPPTTLVFVLNPPPLAALFVDVAPEPPNVVVAPLPPPFAGVVAALLPAGTQLPSTPQPLPEGHPNVPQQM